ncbi:hypothetical protein G6F40_016448 [Rhizopus arrhizus]|nr:hypothetical protein G6F40_016448 [Rhizopus arrhizus]KAG1389043.1 hypothetical protein G6F59_015701 [Rhizopus arrhizus]
MVVACPSGTDASPAAAMHPALPPAHTWHRCSGMDARPRWKGRRCIPSPIPSRWASPRRAPCVACAGMRPIVLTSPRCSRSRASMPPSSARPSPRSSAACRRATAALIASCVVIRVHWTTPSCAACTCSARRPVA